MNTDEVKGEDAGKGFGSRFLGLVLLIGNGRGDLRIGNLNRNAGRV